MFTTHPCQVCPPVLITSLILGMILARSVSRFRICSPCKASFGQTGQSYLINFLDYIFATICLRKSCNHSHVLSIPPGSMDYIEYMGVSHGIPWKFPRSPCKRWGRVDIVQQSHLLLGSPAYADCTNSKSDLGLLLGPLTY